MTVHSLPPGDFTRLRRLLAAAAEQGFCQPGDAVIGAKAWAFQTMHSALASRDERDQARRLYAAVTHDREGARDLAQEVLR